MIKIPGQSEHAKTLTEQYDHIFFEQHRSLLPAYRTLARLIRENTSPETHELSILDVGCGHGLLVECLRQHDFSAYGVEGSDSATPLWPTESLDFYYVGNLIEARTRSQFPATNYTCSFETAEHLPATISQDFVNALVQHRPQKVFFSAATRWQDLGNNPTHINEQPFSYWVHRFNNAQYELDAITTVAMRNAMFADWPCFENAWWYPKNLLVFQPTTEASLLADQKVTRLADIQLRWFPHPTVKEPFSLSVLRDRSEYHYLIMDTITQATLRLTQGKYFTNHTTARA